MPDNQTQTAAKPADYLRQSANVVLAPAIWVLSSIGFFVDGARTASEFSDLSDNLLVPMGPAFSIWFPIFIGCIAYGIVQALPQNRTKTLYRDTGWWTATGFLFICAWSLITAYAPSSQAQWLSALAFIPTVMGFMVAMRRLGRNRGSLTRVETWLVMTPISLIAGWCSLAMFLNWTPIAYDLFAEGMANTTSSVLMLFAALGLIIWAHKFAFSNRIYLIPPVWGLAWLTARHLGQIDGNDIIGGSAIVGILLIVAVTIIPKPRLEA
jgi:hypothetical protein